MNIHHDDYYNYRDLVNHKEPYIFTVTSTNTIGKSEVSDSSNDVLPIISPILSDFKIKPVASNKIGTLAIGVDIIAETYSEIKSFIFEDKNNKFSVNVDLATKSNDNYDTTKSVKSGGSGAYQFILFNINKNTNYTLTATAVNSAGTSSSISNTFKSLSDPVPPKILSVTPTANKECTVEFDMSEEDYLYFVTATPQNGGDPINTVGQTKSPIIVSGLTGGETYTFTISVLSLIGGSPPSPPSLPVQAYDIPIAPTINSVLNENGKSTITFSGDNLKGSTPDKPKYKVTAIPQSGSSLTVSGDNSPITIEGLTNGANYTFVVSLSTTNNGSVDSSPYTSTLSNVPSKIDNIEVSGDDNIIRIKFKKPNTNMSEIISYTFNAYYTDDTGKIYVENINVLPEQVMLNNDNTITVTFNTTKRNKYSGKSFSTLTSAELAEITTVKNNDKTLSIENQTNKQPYAYVKLPNYKIEKKHTELNCVCFYICLIILVFIVIRMFRKCFSRR